MDRSERNTTTYDTLLITKTMMPKNAVSVESAPTSEAGPSAVRSDVCNAIPHDQHHMILSLRVLVPNPHTVVFIKAFGRGTPYLS